MAMRLFVGNLPSDVNEAELRVHFAAVGPLSFLSLPIDRETGRPRGFAFIEFSERADAEEAMRRLNNQEFKGRPLAVSEARAKDDRSTPRPPRASMPHSSFAATPSGGDARKFGPDLAPRRRRKPAKGAAKSDRGPRRPLRKRDSGPIRFGAQDDDGGDDEVSHEYFSRRGDDAIDHDTE
jgi:RNA recognition motif-containing protein